MRLGHGVEPRIYPAEREAEPRIYPPERGAELRIYPAVREAEPRIYLLGFGAEPRQSPDIAHTFSVLIVCHDLLAAQQAHRIVFDLFHQIGQGVKLTHAVHRHKGVPCGIAVEAEHGCLTR